MKNYFEMFGYRTLGNSRTENALSIISGILTFPLMIILTLAVIGLILIKKGGN